MKKRDTYAIAGGLDGDRPVRRGTIDLGLFACDPLGSANQLAVADASGHVWLLTPDADLPAHLAEKFPKGELISHGARLALRASAAFRPLPEQVFCTESAARLLDAGLTEDFSLSAVLARHAKGVAALGEPASCTTTADRWAAEVRCLHPLAAALRRGIQRASLERAFETDSQTIPILAKADAAGVPVERNRLSELKKSLQREAAGISAKVGEALAAPSLDLENSAQLERALARAGIPVRSATDAALLKFPSHPVVRMVFRFRRFVQQAQSCQDVMDAMDDRGRLPGPHDRLLGILAADPLRPAGQASPGRELIVGQLEAIPVWIAAALSGQNNLVAAAQEGKNLHALTAALLLERPADDITPEELALGRLVNQTLILGQSADTLRGEMLAQGVFTGSDCHELRKKFFRHYPGIACWHEDCQKSARAKIPEIRTPLGRRHLLPASSTTWQRFSACISATLRGGTEDILKLTLLSTRLPESASFCSISPTAVFIECDSPDATLVAEQWESTLRQTFHSLYLCTPHHEASRRSC